MRLDWISKLENNIPFYVIFFLKEKVAQKILEEYGAGAREI